MLFIDGSTGEGGGQVLRTALSLSLVTNTPFRMEKIRAGRKTPGLLRQHLTAVNAAAAIGGAEVGSASVGSRQLNFVPGRVTPGDYRFAVGTAGSATLVLQTVLPALMLADGPSTLTLEGGTHNPFAPPFDFLERAFLPLLARMGPRVEVALERPGFFPAGGGLFRALVEPAPLAPLDLNERGATRSVRARAVVAHLPYSICERELEVAARLLDLDGASLGAAVASESRGPGNAFMVDVESENLTEVFTAFGERGLPAETVATRACEEAAAYLAGDAPVGEHLADQLLLPLALAGGGSFTAAGALSSHATTNAKIIRKFLDVEIATHPVDTNTRVTVG